MKKNYKKGLIEDAMSGLVDILFFEEKVNYKKKNKIKLSKEEEIFDLFFLPPSFVLRQLSKGVKNEKKK